MQPVASSRLFLAIPIPTDIRNEIADRTAIFRGIKGIRTVPSGNYHVTVFFFGCVEDEQIAFLIRGIQKQLLGHSPFSLQTDTLTLFPKRHPRMIWLSFLANYEFSELAHALHPIAKIYWEQSDDEKEQVAHITCARIKSRNVQIPQLPTIRQHVIPITYIELWKSVSEKDGVRYEPIHRFTL
jgi:2'-5' RNA ligase